MTEKCLKCGSEVKLVANHLCLHCFYHGWFEGKFSRHKKDQYEEQPRRKY